ncbi:MAG: cob(I)yrinic acid a,c-diamide adenosyltransferase [Thermoplasmata archaeon]
MDNIIQVYTGDGKGKTTAAFGVALRAVGYNLKTLVIQFLKDRQTGELKATENIEEITVEQYGKPDFIIDGEAQEKDYREAEKAFQRAEKALEEHWDIIILDELNLSIYFELIEVKKVLDLLDKVEDKEIIITGRNAKDEIIERADLVTSMEEVKHPYQKGFTARKGIEY